MELLQPARESPCRIREFKSCFSIPASRSHRAVLPDAYLLFHGLGFEKEVTEFEFPSMTPSGLTSLIQTSQLMIAAQISHLPVLERCLDLHLPTGYEEVWKSADLPSQIGQSPRVTASEDSSVGGILPIIIRMD